MCRSAISHILYSILSLALVRVKCCQTGKLHKASVANLGRADELPLSNDDLKKGANLLWDYGNHSYSVKVVEILSSGKFSLSGFDLHVFTHAILHIWMHTWTYVHVYILVMNISVLR